MFQRPGLATPARMLEDDRSSRKEDSSSPRNMPAQVVVARYIGRQERYGLTRLMILAFLMWFHETTTSVHGRSGDKGCCGKRLALNQQWSEKRKKKTERHYVRIDYPKPRTVLWECRASFGVTTIPVTLTSTAKLSSKHCLKFITLPSHHVYAT